MKRGEKKERKEGKEKEGEEKEKEKEKGNTMHFSRTFTQQQKVSPIVCNRFWVIVMRQSEQA